MANRLRKNSIQFYVDDKELAIIKERMKDVGFTNRGEYMRRLAVDGMTVNVDTSAIRQLCSEFNAIGQNINQVARLVNGSGKVYQSDIQKLQEQVNKIWHILRQSLSAIM